MGKGHYGSQPKYDPSFCEKLVKHMSEGLSYMSFAHEVGVTRDAMYQWERKHPAWKKAKELGFNASLNFWEKMGRGIAAGTIDGNTGAWIFNMINRFRGDWKQRHEVSGDPEAPLTLNVYDYGTRSEKAPKTIEGEARTVPREIGQPNSAGDTLTIKTNY